MKNQKIVDMLFILLNSYKCCFKNVPHGPRQGQYLTHTHSHITRAVAAIDSCFALIGANQHGIAVVENPGKTRVIWLRACVRYLTCRRLVYVCPLF